MFLDSSYRCRFWLFAGNGIFLLGALRLCRRANRDLVLRTTECLGFPNIPNAGSRGLCPGSARDSQSHHVDVPRGLSRWLATPMGNEELNVRLAYAAFLLTAVLVTGVLRLLDFAPLRDVSSRAGGVRSVLKPSGALEHIDYKLPNLSAGHRG